MFDQFKQRCNRLERLDTGDYTLEEYAQWQIEMRYIQAVFGESRALRKYLLPEVKKLGRSASILDVGAGSGQLLSSARRWRLQQQAFTVGAELNHVAVKAIKDRQISAVQCDAMRLPFADNAFDFVICSLFLHHLTDENAIKLLSEMKRVARRRIFVIDLHRSVVAYYLYRIVGRLLLQRFSLEDGSLSILRAFKAAEMEDLAESAGLHDVAVKRSAAYRLVLSGR